ncbi:MAG TPA: carboxypeptidase-like regulatory domain-containing protein [Candidatus Acidoferrum sp.]|nr:carboxypeptidase-like regulatory domain-containing protein [Candidatus Acidoferrum sp.]
MNSGRPGSYKNPSGRNPQQSVFAHRVVLRLGSVLLFLFPYPALAQSQQTPDPQGADAAREQPVRPGTISGTVVDQQGAVVAGAVVKLLREGDASLAQETKSDSDGQFSFATVAPGSFHLTITAPGFSAQTAGGTLRSGEDYTVPPVALAVAASASEVRVSMTPVEIAEAEIKDEEKQRVLGVIPNFYVTYNPAAVPLHPRQKFELAWKLTIDPVNFGVTAAIAGIQQATNDFSGYGQGAQGYGKRLGAAYADSVTGTFIGQAILPSLFKQDPRYFYKGTGSRRSRVFYALANAVICKGDNGRWQPSYSAILGSLAAGGISNLYYPESDRDVTVTFENTLIGIGANAANNILQEFVIRKLTRNAPKYSPPPATTPVLDRPAAAPTR